MEGQSATQSQSEDPWRRICRGSDGRARAAGASRWAGTGTVDSGGGQGATKNRRSNRLQQRQKKRKRWKRHRREDS